MTPPGPRVIGLETEYAVVAVHLRPVPPGTPPPLTPRQAVDELYRGTWFWARSRNHFRRNGGRLYVDVGSHPEYATAECLDVQDVVLQDRAGEAEFLAMVDRANRRLADDGIALHVLKNNVDGHGASFGCHENYQVRLSTAERPDPGLIAFLATRPALTSAGGVGRGDDGQAEFVWSTRAPLIRHVLSADPTHERPMIVTRDEPLGDATRWARLQVVHGDSNVAEAVTALKMTFTATVLDILDEGARLGDLALSDPVAALHAVGRRGPSAPVRLADGRTTTALDLQEAVLEHCEEAGRPVPGARHLVDALRSGDEERLAPTSDWILKRGLLRQAAAAVGGDLAHPRVARLDLAYHDLDAGSGLGERLRRAGLMARLVDDAEIQRAREVPPPTRAALRGEVVRIAEERGLSVSVSWTHVRLDSPPRPQIDLLDPADPCNGSVDDLIAVMQEAPSPAPRPWGSPGAGRPG